MEQGKVYYYRFLAENDAGSHWSPSPGILTSGTFSFAADSWIDVDLSLWLDGSDINADGNYQNEPFGGIVDEWRDKSGGNRHATNGHGPKLLFSQLNQKNILSFDGESQYLRVADSPQEQTTDLDIGQEGTLFFVIRAPNAGSGSFLLSKGWNDNAGWSFKNNSLDLPTFGIRGTEGPDESSSHFGWPEYFSVFSVRKTPDKRLFRMDGNQAFDFVDPGTVQLSEGKDLVIGALATEGVSQFAQFEIAELLLFDQSLSNNRLSMIEGYLAHKWGTSNSLPDSHSYQVNPPVFENRPEILLSDPYYVSQKEDQNFTISTNRPATHFSAEGLPVGLDLNASTGLVSGTPLNKGSYAASLAASNHAGTYNKQIEFIVTNFKDWEYELELNVTGYSDDATIKNFPVFIELNSSVDGFHYQQFADKDGKDLRFLSANKSTELAYEIIEWNPEGTSSFWVLLPELKSDTSLFAIWGNPSINQRPTYTADGTVWEEYRAVWKMDQLDGNLVRDSASGYHGISPNSSGNLLDGVIGKSIQISSEQEYIELPTSVYFPPGTEQASISFWAYNQDQVLADRTLFHVSSPLGSHMEVLLPGNDGALHWLTGSGSLDDASVPLSEYNNQWVHWVLQIDLLSGRSKVFRNGVYDLNQSGFNQPFGASIESLRIGSRTDGTQHWIGKIDEFKITNYLESPQKIAASYANQRPDGPSFMSIGTVKGPPVILSIEKLQAFVGKDFSFILQTFPQNDGNFSAVGLPAGLSINSATGEISGNPVQDGKYQVTAIVDNDFGKVTKPLDISIFEPSTFSKQMEFSCSNYQGTTTLKDFPMLVEMNGSISGFNLRQFASMTGNDLRFFDPSGKEYSYEIETFDLAANRLVAWVKVPSLDANTTFSAYWGNPSLAEYPPDYSINGNVWSSSYRGVWHMRPTVESSILSDSTSYRNHLTDENGLTRNSGLAGSARQLFGQPDHYLTAPTNYSLENLALGEFSFSGWIWLDGTPEQRINEAFYGLGYDITPQSSYFDTANNFLTLEPDGGRILRNGPNNQGLSFGNADDFKTLDLGITRSSGFMTALMTRFSPPVSASYQFRIQVGEADFASLWIDQNKSGTFPDFTICSSDITVSQPLALDEDESYNLLLAHGVPSGSISSNLSIEVKSDHESFSNWTLMDPANPDQIKLYHLTFDGNLSDRISSVTLFQDGPTERLNLLGLTRKLLIEHLLESSCRQKATHLFSLKHGCIYLLR